jgi:hypothetical protein
MADLALSRRLVMTKQKRRLPDWFRIVTEFGFPNGPTIPFLLGATVLRPLNAAPKNSGIAQAALYELLRTIATEDCRVLVRDCPTTDAYVVVPNQYGAQSLEWDPSMDVTSVDALFAVLWKKHSREISAGSYSRNVGTNKWEPFNDTELTRIRQLVRQ